MVEAAGIVLDRRVRQHAMGDDRVATSLPVVDVEPAGGPLPRVPAHPQPLAHHAAS